MTISNEIQRHELLSGSGQTTFTYQFYILDETHIAVYVNGTLKTINTDYTVTGVGEFSGGTVVFNSGQTAGAIIILERAVPYTQTLDYVENEKFPAASHELGLDKMTMLAQDLSARLDRAPVMDQGQFAGFPGPFTLPHPDDLTASQGGVKVLRWNLAETDLALVELVTETGLVGDLVPVVTFGGLPAAGDAGKLRVVSDQGHYRLAIDNGAAWVLDDLPPSVAFADLPPSAPVGDVYQVSDSIRGFWAQGQEANFFPLGSSVINAAEFGVQGFAAVDSNTPDQTAFLQAAIDATGSDRGHRIQLPPGIIPCVGLTLGASNKIHLMGHTQGHTVLRLYRDTDHIFKYEPTTGNRTHSVQMQDIRFDGRACDTGTATTTFDNVHIADAGTSVIPFVNFDRCYFTSARYGLYLGNDVSLAQIVSCVFGSNCTRGLLMDGNGTLASARIIGNWFDENLDYGAYIRGGRNLIANNNFMDNTNVSLLLDSNANNNLVIGNHFIHGSAPFDTVTAIRNNGDNNQFLWNFFDDGHTGNTVVNDAGADGAVWVGYIPDAAAVSLSGTNSRFLLMGDGGNVKAGNGSVASPAWSFQSDSDTGMLRSSANELQFATAGSAAITIRATQLIETGQDIVAKFSTATPAGGARAFSMGSADVGICWGSGAPTLSQPQGSLYQRTDGAAPETRVYVNTNGTTTWLGLLAGVTGQSTVTDGTTTLVVTHGAGGTPSRVLLSRRNNPTNAVNYEWVDTVGATQFTINVAADPGASGVTYDWIALR